MEHDRSNRDRVSADYVEKLRETDRYLDALSASMSTDHASAEHNDSAEYDDVAPELTSLFQQWRTDVTSAPLPPAPTVESLLGQSADKLPLHAVSSTASNAGSPPQSNTNREEHPRHHTWRREAVCVLSGAAAFLVIAAAGLTIAIQSAGMNDPLWPMNRALFASNADDIELATHLNQDIDRARSLASSGQDEEAMRVLDRVQTKVKGIGTESRRSDVQKRLDDTRKVFRGGNSGVKASRTTKSHESVENSEETRKRDKTKTKQKNSGSSSDNGTIFVDDSGTVTVTTESPGAGTSSAKPSTTQSTAAKSKKTSKKSSHDQKKSRSSKHSMYSSKASHAATSSPAKEPSNSTS